MEKDSHLLPKYSVKISREKKGGCFLFVCLFVFFTFGERGIYM